ncbi:putative disease resistance protein At4g19050 [Durio zibethinus]|uniref:Disease resistance protein At4g19050 n=1 Tax=Durio zibethinus TaxID=66656 RepID=A0A6P5YD60_DURZI|nr:putative disease resistance protein At4g19050 [Durio zibethinus]
MLCFVNFLVIDKKEGQSSEGTQPTIPTPELPKSDVPTAEMKPETAKANEGDAGKILKMLEEGNNEAVVLTGNAGTGKTWLAREIAKSAVSKEGPFYMSLWLSLNDKHKDDDSLRHSIARQFSIPTIGGVWEDVDDIDDKKKQQYDENLKQLPQKVTEKLEEKRREMANDKNEQKNMFLLVLDSEGVVTPEDYDYIMKSLFPFEDVKKIRVLITTRPEEEGFSNKESITVVEIQPLSGVEAASFLKKRVGDNVSKHPGFEILRHDIEKRSKVLPVQIIMLAAALNHIAEDGPEARVRAFDTALDILKQADKDDPIPLLHFTYEMLPGDCVIDCFWHSWNFLGKHGGVQYNELITHWILEGHLDLAAGVKTAYEKGYDIMMELIDRGMLKMQEDNLIVLEGATINLWDHRCRELFETSNLGLATVLEGENRQVFERMAPADGMMRTVSVDKKGESVSSLLIDGSHPCREAPDTFFQAKPKLKVLALFYPRLTSLPKPISEMKNLLVLVVRGCYLLKDIKYIENLKELIVLEISGSPFLEEMSEELFACMSKLRSLNLSALKIKSLPSSLSNLTELRRLILRKCSFLESLPKLANLKNLEVIDLSGSSSLIKIQEKSFKSFKSLRFIDFSETKIEKLPIVQTLENLKILLARGCDRLFGLRLMKYLPNLKVLDVSGAIRIKEIYFDCFDHTDNLSVLNLSKTGIRFLPDSLSKNLLDLRVQGCSKLEKLLSPKEEDLKKLESLDLSDSSSLEKFPENFFENLTSLQSLNLSKTKVGSLPSLLELRNLRRLFLKGCSFQNLPELTKQTRLVKLDLSDCESLTELPSLVDLAYLEIINLSGCKALSKINQSFEKMSRLQVLNLSETQISSLPSLCEPSKLHSLILRNCTKLEKTPNFGILLQLEQLDLRGTSSLKNFNVESLKDLTQLQTLKLPKIEGTQSLSALKKLEILDLSEEAVDSLPTLDSLSNLRQLLLRDCSSLKELPSLNSLSHLEVLDLSGTKVKNLPDKINPTHLKRLYLPEGVIEEFKGEKVKCLPLELKLDRCCISKASDIPEGDVKSRIIVHGTELFKSLKENSKLLESIMHSISAVHSQSKDEDNYGDSRKHLFRDIYSKIRKLPSVAEDGQSLEIHGFDYCPTDIEVVLEQVKYVLLVENNFLKNLSDLKPGSLKNIKGCWLERCNEMESIFVEAGLGKWQNLEILWMSNLLKLKSLHDKKIQSLNFGNLKHLYIDCCPTLETVFSIGQIPENLETLRITFCDKLKTVVVPANGEVQTTGSADKKIQATSSADNQVQNTSSSKMKVQTRSSANKEVQTTISADQEGLAQTMSSANKEVQTTSSADKEVQTTSTADKEVQTASSTDKEAQAQTTSSADKEVQTTSSAEQEVLAQTMSSTNKEVQTTSSADKEVQTTSSADKEVQTASSADKEAQAQTTSPADKEVQAQAMSSANKEVQTASSADKVVQTASSADKEVQTTSSADKEAQAQTKSSSDNEVQARTTSSAEKEVKAQAMSSADKEMEAQTTSSADKEQPMSRTKLKHLHISYCPMLETVFLPALLPNSELPNLQTLHLLELPAWTASSIGIKLNGIKNVKVSPNVEKSLRSGNA